MQGRCRAFRGGGGVGGGVFQAVNAVSGAGAGIQPSLSPAKGVKRAQAECQGGRVVGWMRNAAVASAHNDSSARSTSVDIQELQE